MLTARVLADGELLRSLQMQVADRSCHLQTKSGLDLLHVADH